MNYKEKIEGVFGYVEPGTVYKIYKCCIRPYDPDQKVIRKMKNKKVYDVCPEHGGVLVDKYKACSTCGAEHTGIRVKIGGFNCEKCRSRGYGKWTAKKVVDRAKEVGVSLVPGEVYNVFECCIKQVDSKPLKRKRKLIKGKTHLVCPDHEGIFIIKYRSCPDCGVKSIGKRLNKSAGLCPNCLAVKRRRQWMSEHPWGAYCKKYQRCELRLASKQDCWACKEFEPWFPNSGPKKHYRKTKWRMRA